MTRVLHGALLGALIIVFGVLSAFVLPDSVPDAVAGALMVLGSAGAGYGVRQLWPSGTKAWAITCLSAYATFVVASSAMGWVYAKTPPRGVDLFAVVMVGMLLTGCAMAGGLLGQTPHVDSPFDPERSVDPEDRARYREAVIAQESDDDDVRRTMSA